MILFHFMPPRYLIFKITLLKPSIVEIDEKTVVCFPSSWSYHHVKCRVENARQIFSHLLDVSFISRSSLRLPASSMIIRLEDLRQTESQRTASASSSIQRKT